jgi:nicotinamidase-related amidase
MGLITRTNAILLIIDFQASLAPAMVGLDEVTNNIVTLIEGARRLDVPLRVTEHCSHKIGQTVASIREKLHPSEILEKTTFDALSEPSISEHFTQLGRTQIVTVGIESHVCVLQSALGLLRCGYEPYVVSDAVTSRGRQDKQAALARAASQGIQCVTTEMVLFEWLERGDAAGFRELIPMIKRLKNQSRGKP